jgi:hypothetical protein
MVFQMVTKEECVASYLHKEWEQWTQTETGFLMDLAKLITLNDNKKALQMITKRVSGWSSNWVSFNNLPEELQDIALDSANDLLKKLRK